VSFIRWKLILDMLFIFALGRSAAFADAPPAIEPALRVEKSPVIDGRLTDETWQKSFRNWDGRFLRRDLRSDAEVSSESRATLMLVYTDKALYIGFESVANREGEKATAAQEAHGLAPGLVGVELCPARGGPRYRFAVAANAETYEEPSEIAGGRGGWRGAAGKTPQGWTAEFEIPFSWMGSGAPRDFESWEISCFQEKAPAKNSSGWSVEVAPKGWTVAPGRCVFVPRIRNEHAVQIVDAETGRICWISPLDIHRSLGPAAPLDREFPRWALPVLDPSWKGGQPKVLRRGEGVLAKFDYTGWFARASDFPNCCGIVDTKRLIMRGGAPGKTRDPLATLQRLKEAGVRKMIILCENEQNVDVDQQMVLMRKVGIEPVKIDWNVLAREKRAGSEPTWQRLKEIILQGNIFIQCVWGADRTGAIVARLRTDFYGWTKEEAYAEMVGYGYGFVYRRSEVGGYEDWLRFYGYPPAQYEPPIAVALPNPMASAILVERAPKMDGSLDDELWKRGFRFCDFHTVIDNGDNTPWMNLPSRAKHLTSAILLYTDKALYVGIECDKEVPQGGSIPYKVSDKGRDGDYWEDDSVNLFVQPSGEKQKYFQFIANANGNVYDGQGRDKEWNAEWKCATGKTARGWTAVFEIPFSSLGAGAPAAGDSWGLGLARNEAAQDEVIGWNNFMGGFHRPERFGQCLFLQKAPRAFAVQATDGEGPLIYSIRVSNVAEIVQSFIVPPAIRPENLPASSRAAGSTATGPTRSGS